MTKAKTEPRGMEKSAYMGDDNPTLPAPVVSQAAGVLAVIERAAMDPAINVEKMERLLAMQERILAAKAKVDYFDAMRRMKPLLPVIERKGRIVIRDKNDQEKIIQSTPYALWEDIDELISPILAEHGFVLTFENSTTPEGKLITTAIVTHTAEGAAVSHTERASSFPMPYDSSGSKNSVQSAGSTQKYGMRYSATLALNIRTRGEDDDGKAGGDAADADVFIGEDIQAQIAELALKVNTPLKRVLEFVGVEEIQQVTHGMLPKIRSALKEKMAVQRKAAAK